MYQFTEQTDQEKFNMYKKLSKREVILMLIEANKQLSNKPISYYPYSDKFEITCHNDLTFGDTCSCNPKNGGNGICHCIMGNEPLKGCSYYLSGNDTSGLCNNCKKPFWIH